MKSLRFNLDLVAAKPEHFGVLVQPCLLTATTRGEFNVARGWIAGPHADTQGYEVTSMGADRELTSPFFLTAEQARLMTAPIDGVSLRLQRPEDQVLHAQRAIHVQQLSQLQTEIARRCKESSKQGSFDTFAETTLTERANLLQQLIVNTDVCLAAD